MKKIIKTLLIFLIIIALPYNTFANQINSTKYIIKYIEKLQNQVYKIEDKYDIKQDNTLKQEIKKLEKIKKVLKNPNITKTPIIIKNTVKQLKIINNKIKAILKQKILQNKKKLKKITLIYKKHIKKATNKIDSIVKKIAKKLFNKKYYTQKDRQIIDILYIIKQKINKLNSIEQKTFYSRKQLNNYIIQEFNQIKNLFHQIRQIAK